MYLKGAKKNTKVNKAIKRSFRNHQHDFMSKTAVCCDREVSAETKLG